MCSDFYQSSKLRFLDNVLVRQKVRLCKAQKAQTYYRPQGKVKCFTPVCLLPGGGGGKEAATPQKEHGTRPEVASYTP